MNNLSEDRFIVLMEASAIKEGVKLLIDRSMQSEPNPMDPAFIATLEFFKTIYRKWDKVSRSNGLFIDANKNVFVTIEDLGRLVNCN